MKKKVVFFMILTTLICLDGCGVYWKGRTPEYEKLRIPAQIPQRSTRSLLRKPMFL